MAPRSGLPEMKVSVTWSLRRPWESPTCAVGKKIIWPWHMAWRKRYDHSWGGKVFASDDKWVTEDEYLILKLKGELDSV